MRCVTVVHRAGFFTPARVVAITFVDEPVDRIQDGCEPIESLAPYLRSLDGMGIPYEAREFDWTEPAEEDE